MGFEEAFIKPGSTLHSEEVSTQVELTGENYAQAFDASNKGAWSPDQASLNVYNSLIEKTVPFFPTVTPTATGTTATGSAAPAPMPVGPSPVETALKFALIGAAIYFAWTMIGEK